MKRRKLLLIPFLLAGAVKAAELAAAMPGAANLDGEPSAYATDPVYISLIPTAELLTLGLREEQKGDLTGAFNYLLAAYQRDPSNRFIGQALARATQSLNRFSELRRQKDRSRYVNAAKRRRQNAEDQEDRFNGRLLTSKRLVENGELLKASDQINKILEQSPRHRKAREERTAIGRRFSEQLREGRFLTPQHFYSTLGVFLYNLEDWPRASENFKKVLSLGELPKDLAEANIGEYAVKSEEKVRLTEWEKERENLREDARVLMAARAYLKAVPPLETILAREPNDAEAGALLKNAKDKISEDSRLENEAQKEAEISASLKKGQLFYEQRQYMDSLTETARVLELDPQNIQARKYLKLAKAALVEAGLPVPAVTAQDAVEIKYREGLRFYGNENYQEAEKSFRSVLAIDPDHAGAKNALENLKK